MHVELCLDAGQSFDSLDLFSVDMYFRANVTQTHCHICKRHLRKGGIWCVICKAYIHVLCSGLQSSKFYYDGFSCIQCNPRTLQKGPTLPTYQQAQPASQLKKKLHRQHLKQTYSPMQHNFIHRSQQSLEPSPTPGKLSTKNMKLK